MFACIRQLESSNNYRAPGGGAYQFTDPTWHGLGQEGSAQDAPPETQDAMAERLGCAVGTIINEQRRIGSIIDRHAESDDQRGILLRKVLDLLHEGGERP